MNSSETQPRSRRALRRLLILLAVAAGLIIFAYGWTDTDIDFTVPQEPQRQTNVGNALRELLSPNVFTQEYEVENTTTTFVMGCPDGFTAPEIAASGDPYIIVTPACGSSGDIVTIEGRNFAPDGLARVNWIAVDGERRIRQIVGSSENNFVTLADGTFRVEVEVPRIRGSAGETHTVEVQGRFPVGGPHFSETTMLVLERMVETIFLALIATAVSILPSAILSFFAAHNLMRPIRIPLGDLLVSLILLPIGAALGAVLLGELGRFMLRIDGGAVESAGLGLIVAFGAVASTRRIRGTEAAPSSSWVRGVVSALIVAVVAVAALGLLGGVLKLVGRATSEGTFGFIGIFTNSIGQLIELAIVPLAAIIGGFTLSSIGTTLTRGLLKTVSVPASRILGAVMGAIVGALLLGLMATIGLGAAWLGLLVPVVAAALAGAILPAIYRLFLPKTRRVTRTENLTLRALSLIGAVAAFAFTYSTLNISRAVVEGALPPQRVLFSIGGLDVYAYVAEAMLIGAVLGGILCGLVGTRSNFAIGSVLYTVTRTILNGLRSIEPLIMGLVFVIWVGIGPFAGVLALALHSVASLGKLYSEQIETIDSGPIEALQSTGANRLQTIIYAVVPQIVPSYIAFTMYRWDINVRMSTIIGFVGGGGIGFLLQQQINLLRYRDAGVAVLAIAIVVSILDYASAAIRERFV